VLNESRQKLLSIPLDFAKFGRCNTIAFVLSQVHFCFEETGVLRGDDGEPSSKDDPIPSGSAIFVRDDKSTDACTPRKGPRFKYKYRAPIEGAGCGLSDTMSNSSRSTPRQTGFRRALIARDNRCLMSDTGKDWYVGSHILPQSRPDVCAFASGASLCLTSMLCTKCNEFSSITKRPSRLGMNGSSNHRTGCSFHTTCTMRLTKAPGPCTTPETISSFMCLTPTAPPDRIMARSSARVAFRATRPIVRIGVFSDSTINNARCFASEHFQRASNQMHVSFTIVFCKNTTSSKTREDSRGMFCSGHLRSRSPR
jgi:hypothetical protein